MLWKRMLKDKEGKHWRRIYKSMLLLDHLIKNGSDRVIESARDHLCADPSTTSVAAPLLDLDPRRQPLDRPWAFLIGGGSAHMLARRGHVFGVSHIRVDAFPDASLRLFAVALPQTTCVGSKTSHTSTSRAKTRESTSSRRAKTSMRCSPTTRR